MKTELSESTIDKIAEGDVVVIVNHRGRIYAKAFLFKDKKAGTKIKVGLEATRRILLGEKYET